jgi:hypothetical protein
MIIKEGLLLGWRNTHRYEQGKGKIIEINITEVHI